MTNTVHIFRCANPNNYPDCEKSFSFEYDGDRDTPVEFKRIICTTCFNKMEADNIREEQYHEALLAEHGIE